MALLLEQLELARCPHCKIDRPRLDQVSLFQTNSFNAKNKRFWRSYVCHRCGGVVTAAANNERGSVLEMYPQGMTIDEAIPERGRIFLDQAINSIHAPSGSIMLSASAVDAMLKVKGYKDGSLYSRIDKAKDDNLITKEMADWAHAVRLDANDQRHADENADLPTESDAQRCIDFVLALGQFIFVLPNKIEKGLADATSPIVNT